MIKRFLQTHTSTKTATLSLTHSLKADHSNMNCQNIGYMNVVFTSFLDIWVLAIHAGTAFILNKLKQLANLAKY